jgi:hypothetical protein
VSAELLAVDGPVARVALRTSGCGGGCSPVPEAAEEAVREALTHAAPEIERVECAPAAPPPAPQALIPLDALFTARAGRR